jgi:hypothetical protein
LFGDVFAQRLHPPTAFRALPGRFWQVRSDLAGQMLRQWLARCLFCSRARRLRDFDWRCTFVCHKLFKAQFELLDLTVKLLRLATELHTAQLGNEQFRCSTSAAREANAACCESTVSCSLSICASRSHSAASWLSSMAFSVSTSSGSGFARVMRAVYAQVAPLRVISRFRTY